MTPEKNLEATLLFQNNEIARQRKEMTESIRYASYIQKALLPSDNILKTFIPEHFVFYQPKDIVSGDFYWVSKKKHDVIIAVADCTGHGVPGAFMSILGITALNEIINNGNYKSSGSVLNLMREKIMKALNQTGDENEQKDGIDMGLCIINTENGLMEYSGAFNPAYIIKDEKLFEIAGDKMPIGVAPDEEKPFKTNYIQLEEGDVVYLFSDGFADQFGGHKGKKFKYQPFREMLLKIYKLPMDIQKVKINRTFNDWKSSYHQLDDIVILGFRYHI